MTAPRYRTAGCLLLILVAATGCSSTGDERHGPESSNSSDTKAAGEPSRDSPGISEWTLSAAPLLSIGTSGGDPDHELFRVADAFRMPDGRIAVANGGTAEIRVYDQSGNHLWNSGRDGEGPGEFRMLVRLLAYRVDSLAAADLRLRRVSIFDGEGRFYRSLSIGTPTAASPQLEAVLPDGSFLVKHHKFAGGPGITRDTALFVRVSPDGALFDTMAVVGDMRRFSVADGEGVLTGGQPFSPVASARAIGDRILYGDGEEFEVRIRSLAHPGGEFGEETVVRLQRASRELTDEEVGEYKSRHLSRRRAPERQRIHQRMMDVTPFPDRMPAYESFQPDADGNLWVASFLWPEAGPRMWVVLDPEGVSLGTVITPAGLRVTDIGSDYLLGVSRDSLGIERVEVYALRKDRH